MLVISESNFDCFSLLIIEVYSHPLLFECCIYMDIIQILRSSIAKVSGSQLMELLLSLVFSLVASCSDYITSDWEHLF